MPDPVDILIVGEFQNYRQAKGFESLTLPDDYDAAVAAFRADSVPMTHYWASHLRDSGLQVAEVMPSVGPLQRCWARAHDVSTTEADWFEAILTAQVAHYRPRLLFVFEPILEVPAALRQRLRDTFGCRIVAWRGAAMADWRDLGDLDMVLTCLPLFVDECRAVGVTAAMVPWGFEAALRRYETADKDLAFTFCGRLANVDGAHSLRFQYVDTLMRHTDLEFWGGERLSDSDSREFALQLSHHVSRGLRAVGIPRDFLAKVPGLRMAIEFESYFLKKQFYRAYPGRIHPPVYGAAYLDILGRSCVTFNKHADFVVGYAANLRTFEATGLGACLLTDWQDKIAEQFELDHEIITFKTPAECVEKYTYLRDHPETAAAVAAAGQRRTLRDYTLRHSVDAFAAAIRPILGESP